MERTSFAILGFAALCALLSCSYGHGLMTSPRCRGSLNTQRNIPDPVLDPNAPIDYCPHCQNCGGVGMVARGGPWKLFKPFEYARKGITLCGDPTGMNDHTRKGRFANPPSTPYVANYEPGSVANFEYDITAHHNGFIEFYLCEVSRTGDVVNSVEYFKQSCYQLERSPHPECEAGTATDCGPIDPQYPGRWVLPCRNGDSDQVFGGPNGKMAYKIPNIHLNDAVIVSYWLTQNSCTSPDGFMDNYNYPEAWGKCPGDGGSVGGHPFATDCISAGRTPEEFFNCADVQVGGSREQLPVRTQPPLITSPISITTTMSTSTQAATSREVTSRIRTTTERTRPTRSSPPQKTEIPGKCVDRWMQCGGRSWKGPTTCCERENSCVMLSDWYYQCLPDWNSF